MFVEGDIRMPERLGARLTFVTSVNDVRHTPRYQRHLGTQAPDRTARARVTARVEIADRPEITDVEAMESFFEDIGFQSFEDGRHRSYETDAALEVQEAVEQELGGRIRPSGHVSS